MANIIFDVTTTETNDLIIECGDKLIANGNEVSLQSAPENNTISKDVFESILKSQIIIFFFLNNEIDEKFVVWMNNIVEIMASDDKSRELMAVCSQDVDGKFLSEFPVDRYVYLSDNWQQNIFLQVNKVQEEVVDALTELSFQEDDEYIKEEVKAKKEIKHNIESNAPEFINNAITRLAQRGKKLNLTANIYFISGYVSIATGVAAGVFFFIHDREYFGLNENWSITVFFALKSIIIIGLLVAMAKYAFNLGKAYMHESLKVEDRIHAISFGQFYLNVYKAGVTAEDLKDVFRDWNITNQATAFLTQNANDFDPKYLETIAKVIEKTKDVVKVVASATKSDKD